LGLTKQAEGMETTIPELGSFKRQFSPMAFAKSPLGCPINFAILLS
jgi:hypothetical protein